MCRIANDLYSPRFLFSKSYLQHFEKFSNIFPDFKTNHTAWNLFQVRHIQYARKSWMEQHALVLPKISLNRHTCYKLTAFKRCYVYTYQQNFVLAVVASPRGQSGIYFIAPRTYLRISFDIVYHLCLINNHPTVFGIYLRISEQPSTKHYKK
jgi:hypothetical protein